MSSDLFTIFSSALTADVPSEIALVKSLEQPAQLLVRTADLAPSVSTVQFNARGYEMRPDDRLDCVGQGCKGGREWAYENINHASSIIQA
jgi:hypothetical protein